MKVNGLRTVISSFLLWCCILVPANAQGLLFPSKMFTNRDGLSQLQVRSLYEDSRGYLWIGTQRGINKYDGFHIVSYGPLHGIPNEQVLSITEDANGRIWYATQKYLVEFDGVTARLHPFPESINYPIITSEGDRIWISQPQKPRRAMEEL